MNVIYSNHFNIDLGLLNYLHPFDGTKFRTIYNGLSNNSRISFVEPDYPINMEAVDQFLTSTMRKKVRDSVFILRALEVPEIPFVNFSFLDRKVLSPMRWGVSGTLLGAIRALESGEPFWNLAGGYHHAMPQSMEGFCIYNDIGITYQQLIKSGQLTPQDKVLLIDIDAHHGNGNAQTFMDNSNLTLLDVYNASIYPVSSTTRRRVDISVEIQPGTAGPDYLEKYNNALNQLSSNYRLAFVVAGTDVLSSDKLGGLNLNIDEVAERERLTLKTLGRHSI